MGEAPGSMPGPPMPGKERFNKLIKKAYLSAMQNYYLKRAARELDPIKRTYYHQQYWHYFNRLEELEQ